MNDRYIPCQILYDNGVACTCCFEDAVAHHGVPTALNDLFLLVDDIDVAAQVLLHHGWVTALSQQTDVFCFFSDKKCKPFRRLVPSTQSSVHTFLLKATDWGFSTERLNGGLTVSTFLPRLAELVDALIDSILDVQEGERISGHLVMMVLYLYGYVDVLKQDSFADQLAYEHRQWHYDMKAIHTVSLRFIAHERTVQQQLRDKTVVPYFNPWNEERDCLS